MRAYATSDEFGATANGGSTSGSGYGMQTGVDLISREGAGGDWLFGLTAQYGSANAESKSGRGATSKLAAMGYGIGATLTWTGLNDLYLDMQGQMNWVQSDFTSSDFGELASGVASTALLASMEAGRSFGISETISLVPQGQISWGRMDGDDFQTSHEADVSFGSGSSLTGRFGVAAEFDGGYARARVSGSVVHELSGTREVVVDDAAVEDNSAKTRAQFGFGVSGQVEQNSMLFLEGVYSFSLGGEDDQSSESGGSVSGGIQWRW